MTLFEFLAKFPTENAVVDYFFDVRYHGELTCPHCGVKVKVYKDRKRARVCHCRSCYNSFSPFKGTIFEKTTTIHTVLNAKKRISACQLQREIGTAYRTAWRMLNLIREVMGNEDRKQTFDCFVEIDETYLGGKPRKENARFDENGNRLPSTKPKRKRGRGTSKTAVVGIKERGTGRVYMKVMLPDSEGRRLSGKQLYAYLEEVCKEGTKVITDDFKSYGILDRKTDNKFFHLKVNHSLGQFSAGNGIDTNGIENSWSLVKRQYVGTHHHYSLKHTQGYLDETSFRQGNREIDQSFDKLLGQCVRRKANDAAKLAEQAAA